MPETVWLGGGTGSGKSTVARILAERHGLRVFPVDAFWYVHSELLAEREPSPDEQWLDRSPERQAAEFEETSRRRLGLVLTELERLPAEPPTLVEGPQVLADALPAGARAVFLAATVEFQRAVLEPRPMPPTRDPTRTLANRIAKDRLYAERVRELAERHAFPVVTVDGSRRAEEIAADVEQLLALVPSGATAAALADARRWEENAVTENLRRWRASPNG